MRNRLKLLSPAAFAALGMALGLAVTARAQDGPVRIVQSGDRTIYLVQGGSSWMLVPDQIPDSDLAALTPRGELDGIIPSTFLGPPPQAPVAESVTTTPNRSHRNARKRFAWDAGQPRRQLRFRG